MRNHFIYILYPPQNSLQIFNGELAKGGMELEIYLNTNRRFRKPKEAEEMQHRYQRYRTRISLDEHSLEDRGLQVK